MGPLPHNDANGDGTTARRRRGLRSAAPQADECPGKAWALRRPQLRGRLRGRLLCKERAAATATSMEADDAYGMRYVVLSDRKTLHTPRDAAARLAVMPATGTTVSALDNFSVGWLGGAGGMRLVASSQPSLPTPSRDIHRRRHRHVKRSKGLGYLTCMLSGN